MELAEQFKQHLLNDELDTLSFFLGLSESDQKSLKPIMEELATKDPSVYVYDPYGDYLISRKLSSASQLKICASYLYNHTTFKKYFMRLGRGYYEYEYYKIYRPKWLLSDFKENAIWIRYPHWLGNIPYGLQFDDADIVNALVSSTSYWNYETKEYVFDISHFYSYPIVLDQHIWLIFNEPSEVHLVDRYHSVQGWQGIIAQLVEDKKIDRQRVLKECLLTTTRNFNKLAAGWFYDLFELLEPTEEEIIGLMPEFMLVLNGTHTKPINNVLKQFKTLCQRDEFQTDEFLTISEVLLASDVKAVINNTFAVFDKMAKAYPKKREELSTLACTAFIHNDEKIQTKVAKFVLKYGDITDESLSGNIANYYPELFSSVKTLLDPFSLDTHEEVEDIEYEYTPINPLDDAHRISIPDSFDDQIFFVTQAFENNEPYHFDVYLAVMAQLLPQITQDNIKRLAPAMKNAIRAFKTVNKRIGYIEGMMGLHFLETSRNLLSHHPDTTIQNILSKLDADKPYNPFLDSSDDANNSTTYTLDLTQTAIHNSMANRIYSKLLTLSTKSPLSTKANSTPSHGSENTQITLLSTPTHTPCFIDLATFCKRLRAYIDHNVAVDSLDFQLAISRLVLAQPEPYTQTDIPQLTGEYGDILGYLTQEIPLPLDRCHTKALWAAAVYRKHQPDDIQQFIDAFDLQDELSFCLSTLSWHVHIEKDDAYRFTRLKTQLEHIGKPINSSAPALLYHQDIFRTQLFYIPDIPKLISLSPFIPHVVIYHFVLEHLGYGGSYSMEVDEEQVIHQITPIFMQTWQFEYNDSAYLMLACMMTVGKKSCTALAGELWLSCTTQNNINNQRLGSILGTLTAKEFSPLKRFTDLINQQLLNISTLHNQALITLISNMLPAMNDTPIKGTKKLLELYLELLAVTKTKPAGMENHHQISEKLTTWAETKSLKTVIKKLQAV